MVRLCVPAKVSEATLAGLLVLYLGSLAAAQANPARLPPHTVNLLTQGGNVAALGALIATVAAYNRAAGGCGGRWTWSWVTMGVLAANLAVRLGAVARLRAAGLDADNHKAKYVRWDTAAKTVGVLAVLAEMYYALVPRMRFRTTFFALGLVFVLPVVLALPRMLASGPAADEGVLAEALSASRLAYARYDGGPHAGRVTAREAWLPGVGRAVVVGFAGTENATDAKVDVNIADTPLPLAWTGGAPARAHKGFVDLYAGIREHVRATVGRLVKPDTRALVFAGHSLGGALAALAALDFAAGAKGGAAANAVHMVSFGAPHVGDGNFVKLFDARVPVAVRVVNPFDPVPKLLAAQLLHTKGYYSVASLTRDAPPAAHSLDTYALALSRPAWLRTLGVFAPLTYVGAAAGGVALYHVLRRSA